MTAALRRTKIVATLGPSTDQGSVLETIIRCGVNVVRMNFSHGSADDHRLRAEKVREIAQRLGRHVAILGDLQGPKIRVSTFKEDKVFLRRNGGSIFHHVPIIMKVDPAMFCHTPESYWELAASFNSITTDRLHLAICSLAMKTHTTILPINYHKNLAMFEEWLEPLGCSWKNYYV